MALQPIWERRHSDIAIADAGCKWTLSAQVWAGVHVYVQCCMSDIRD